MSLRDKFKKVKRGEPLKVFVKELDDGAGDYIYIQRKTVAEQNEFESNLRKTAKRGFESAADIVRQRMLITSCLDAEGRPIWTNADMADIAEFPIAMVDGIIKKIREVNEYSEDDIEAMEKNVGETSDGSSNGVSA